jgi:hypothetical protein
MTHATRVLTIHSADPRHPNDFCWGVEGEVAAPPVVCDSPGCGCDIAWCGLNSLRASTTLRVATVSIHFDDIVTAAVGYLQAMGCADSVTAAEADEWGRELAIATAEAAADYPDGTVLRPEYDRAEGQWLFTAEEFPADGSPGAR